MANKRRELPVRAGSKASDVLLLHSMNSFEYLMQAVEGGFLLTIHPVTLSALGISESIPMLCFSELVGLGRDISDHVERFGEYGVVVTPAFVLKNGGDRVLYVDSERGITRALKSLVEAVHDVSARSESRIPEHAHHRLRDALLHVVKFFEPSCNQEQYEWRIASSEGKAPARVEFMPTDVVTFFVASEGERIEVEEALKRRFGSEGIPKVSTLAELGRVLPNGREGQR